MSDQKKFYDYCAGRKVKISDTESKAVVTVEGWIFQKQSDADAKKPLVRSYKSKDKDGNEIDAASITIKSVLPDSKAKYFWGAESGEKMFLEVSFRGNTYERITKYNPSNQRIEVTGVPYTRTSQSEDGKTYTHYGVYADDFQIRSKRPDGAPGAATSEGSNSAVANAPAPEPADFDEDAMTAVNDDDLPF